MKKINKYVYVWVVQGNYGYGHRWEDLTQSESHREARTNLKEYRENEPARHRLIRRRELNPLVEVK